MNNLPSLYHQVSHEIVRHPVASTVKMGTYSAKQLVQNPCPILIIEAVDQLSFSLSRNKGNSRKRVEFHKYTL